MFTVCNQWQAKLIVLGSGEHNHRYLFDLWNIYVVFVRACTFNYYMQQTIEKLRFGDAYHWNIVELIKIHVDLLLLLFTIRYRDLLLTECVFFVMTSIFIPISITIKRNQRNIARKQTNPLQSLSFSNSLMACEISISCCFVLTLDLIVIKGLRLQPETVWQI